MHARGLGLMAAVAATLAAGGCGDRKREREREREPAAPAGDAGVASPTGPTARTLDDAGLAALAAVTIPGHRVEVVRRGPDFGALIGVADMMASLTVSACVTCKPLDGPRWEAERAALTAIMAPGPGDRLAIERVSRGGWPLVELRARRTVEDVPQAAVLALWNDGVVQMIVSCEHPGGDQAERACVALVEAAALAYLPALAP
jgi:hypothetical protein